MDFISPMPPSQLLKTFDKDLQEFYYAVINRELDVTSSGNGLKMKRALREIVTAYIKETTKNGASKICFDSSAKRCAYVMKHSPCFTAAVARHLLNLLISNPHTLQKCVLQQRLNVCCIGGGPASDVVAVSKVVTSVYHCLSRNRKKLNFTVTVIDLSEGWETTGKNVMKTLECNPRFFNSEEMSLNFKFLKADLTQPLNSNVKDVLMNADVLTMVYFLSAVNGSSARDKSPKMLEEIFKLMKNGAFLLYLDSAAFGHYEGISAVAKNLGNLNVIYGPHLKCLHTLSLSSVKKHLELYAKHVNAFCGLTYCFLSTCAWVKVNQHQPSEIKHIAQKDFDCCSRNYEKKKAHYMTNKLLIYCSRLQRLLIEEFGYASYEFEEEDDGLDLATCVKLNRTTLFQTKSKKKRIFTNFD
ncbi:uncharacterized protein LOC118201651 [Stegodyphus dumicola]|uniref:uncharacterized protein LOC118201651 n=1 Tax=Stegodyphus dumicola TaxID=202533 RepID=UPI0015A9A4F6|nr:uncharacterized protein LOC118201651 [Stegodyphus dumicola]